MFQCSRTITVFERGLLFEEIWYLFIHVSLFLLMLDSLS